jgi:steroid 5-alpha reductase family enzyme
LLLDSALIIFIYMIAWFIIAQIIKNNGIVDVAWGLGFVAVSTYFLISNDVDWNPTRIGLWAMVSIWGLRLSIHIANRSLGKPEDYRYQNFRKSWGKHQYLGAFFQVFMLQGIFMCIILMPIYAVYYYKPTEGFPTVLQMVGFSIFVFGFLFEAIGDYQLLKFSQKPENKGHIIQTGLWKYTRHPNYFGEATLWWGIAVYALSTHNGWIGLVAPIVVTVLVTKVSGVAMLERKYRDNPEFQAYAAKTPAFFPNLFIR